MPQYLCVVLCQSTGKSCSLKISYISLTLDIKNFKRYECSPTNYQIIKKNIEKAHIISSGVRFMCRNPHKLPKEKIIIRDIVGVGVCKSRVCVGERGGIRIPKAVCRWRWMPLEGRENYPSRLSQ